MIYKREGRARPARPTTIDATAKQLDAVSVPPGPRGDRYAWSGIRLNDGRVISIAWLRGYPGAAVSPPADCPICGCGRPECTDAPDTPRCDGGWHIGPPCTHSNGEPL